MTLIECSSWVNEFHYIDFQEIHITNIFPVCDQPLQPVSEVDMEMVDHAREVFRSHLFALMTSMLSGLLTLMYVPSIAKILRGTTETTTPVGAFKRYLSTINHVNDWYQSEELTKVSLKKVRRLHAKSSFLSKTNGGDPITQFDLVVTQWAFIGPAILFPERSGNIDKIYLNHIL